MYLVNQNKTSMIRSSKMNLWTTWYDVPYTSLVSSKPSSDANTAINGKKFQKLVSLEEDFDRN